MNYRAILKIYVAERQLTDDETVFLNTLRQMSESERELLAEIVGPRVKVNLSKKPATKRMIEKCATVLVNGETCGLTRRAAIHREDSEAVEAHEFLQASQLSKSKRATEMAAALNDSLKSRQSKEPRCVVCFEVRDHAEHDGGHKFETSVSARANEVLEKYEEVESCASCHRAADENIHHLATAQGYHEFVGSETAVEVGG